MKRTSLGALLMSVLLIVPIALRAVAAPNDGVAATSLSLISLTINGQTVDVAFGEGTATNETEVSSEVDFTAAAVSVDGVISTSTGTVSASANSTTPDDSDADATVPFDIPDAAAGSVAFQGVAAEVDESARSARSTLGQATLEADVAESFVSLTGVSIGNLQEVTTSTASASEGVSISNLFLVPLRKFLERLTTLSADDLIAFAAAVGGDYTAEELALVEAKRQEAISDINTILAPLSGLDVSPLPADASVQEILDYAAACSSDLLLEPICDSIEAVISNLEAAVETLNTTVGELPLISINALEAGVSSETDDTSSSATTGASWGDAQVAGIDIFEMADPEEAMNLLIESVEAVEVELQQLPGFEELEIGVTRLVLGTSTEPVGSRQAASSSLNFLHVSINVPESTDSPALVASLNVLAMGAEAEHEPGETEEPPPPGNDPPIAVDDETTTEEDTPVDISVLPNDSDPDGDEITVVSYTQPSNGTVICTSDGTCTYTPDPGFTGTDTFTYTIEDPYGEQSTATVTITITPSEPPPPDNNPPVAVDDETTTEEDTPVGISVLPNDSDPDGDEITVVDYTQPSNGTVVCTADGSCIYTPNPGFTGTDTFTYTISDPSGEESTATVTITVTPSDPDPDPDPEPEPDNDPPVAVDDESTTEEDTPVGISVLPNDSDPDGDDITVISYTQPSNGTVVCTADGSCIYTPNSGFTGTDTFTYTISDPSGEESTATVTITVTPSDPDPDPDPEPEPDNDPPVAVDDESTTEEDTPVGISVLPNDDGDEISVVDYTQPSNGTVVCTADGSCIYTPNPGFTGTDTFDYTISDPDGEESTATVTINIGDPSDELATPGGDESTTGNSGDNPSVQGPSSGPLGPPGTRGNPGNPGITSQSASDCDASCPLANTGFDLKYSFVGLVLIAAGFALCRSLRGFA